MKRVLHKRVTGDRFAIGAAVVSTAFCAGSAPGQSQSPAVFVANNVSDSVVSFVFDKTGAPVFIDIESTEEAPSSLSLSPDGSHIAVVNATDFDIEELQVIRVEPDASLTSAASTLVAPSPLDVIWINNDIVAVTETDLSIANMVTTYVFDADAGTLTPVDSVGTGSFNSRLAVCRDADAQTAVLYAQTSGDNVIRWFDVAADGTMTLIDMISTGSIFPLELAVSNDCASLYAAGGISGGGSNVLGFSIGADGDLTAIDGSPFQSPGSSPSNVIVSDDNTLAFVGHGSDATVRSFTRNLVTGALESTGFSFDVGLQGTVGDVAVLGNLLLITDESTAIDGIVGLYIFEIQGDGSFIQQGPITDTMGTRPETIRTWMPPETDSADLNGDGSVGPADLALLLGAWGRCPGCPADLDDDGTIGPADLAQLLGAWS